MSQVDDDLVRAALERIVARRTGELARGIGKSELVEELMASSRLDARSARVAVDRFVTDSRSPDHR
jgi:hypothetical protein